MTDIHGLFSFLTILFLLAFTSITLLLGIVMLTYQSVFNKNSQEALGEIVGIEKYLSKNSRNGTQTSQLMYRYILSFTHEDQEYFFRAGFSSSNLQNKIGNQVPIVFIKGRPLTAQMKSNKFFFIGGILSLLICFGISFVLLDEASIFGNLKYAIVFVPILIDLIALKYIISTLYKKAGDKGIISMISNHTPIELEEFMMSENIFKNKIEVSKENSRVYGPWLKINATLITLLFWPLILFGIKLTKRPFIKKLNFFNLDEIKSLMVMMNKNQSLMQEVVFFAGSAVLILLLTHSFFYSLRKTHS